MSVQDGACELHPVLDINIKEEVTEMKEELETYYLDDPEEEMEHAHGDQQMRNSHLFFGDVHALHLQKFNRDRCPSTAVMPGATCWGRRALDSDAVTAALRVGSSWRRVGTTIFVCLGANDLSDPEGRASFTDPRVVAASVSGICMMLHCLMEKSRVVVVGVPFRKNSSQELRMMVDTCNKYLRAAAEKVGWLFVNPAHAAWDLPGRLLFMMGGIKLSRVYCRAIVTYALMLIRRRCCQPTEPAAAPTPTVAVTPVRTSVSSPAPSALDDLVSGLGSSPVSEASAGVWAACRASEPALIPVTSASVCAGAPRQRDGAVQHEYEIGANVEVPASAVEMPVSTAASEMGVPGEPRTPQVPTIIVELATSAGQQVLTGVSDAGVSVPAEVVELVSATGMSAFEVPGIVSSSAEVINWPPEVFHSLMKTNSELPATTLETPALALEILAPRGVSPVISCQMHASEAPTVESVTSCATSEAPAVESVTNGATSGAPAVESETRVATSEAPTAESGIRAVAHEISAVESVTDAATSQAPAVESVINAATSEAPVVESVTDAATSEAPAVESVTHGATSEVPVFASKAHAETHEIPNAASDTHSATSDAPAVASDTHSVVSEVPAVASDTRSSASEVPAIASDTRSSASEVPAVASDTRSSASEVPAVASDTHSSVSEVPVVASETQAAAPDVPASAPARLSRDAPVSGGAGVAQPSPGQEASPPPKHDPVVDMDVDSSWLAMEQPSPGLKRARSPTPPVEETRKQCEPESGINSQETVEPTPGKRKHRTVEFSPSSTATKTCSAAPAPPNASLPDVVKLGADRDATSSERGRQHAPSGAARGRGKSDVYRARYRPPWGNGMGWMNRGGGYHQGGGWSWYPTPYGVYGKQRRGQAYTNHYNGGFHRGSW